MRCARAWRKSSMYLNHSFKLSKYSLKVGGSVFLRRFLWNDTSLGPSGPPASVVRRFSVAQTQARLSIQPNTLNTKLCKFMPRSTHSFREGISDRSGGYMEYTFWMH